MDYQEYIQSGKLEAYVLGLSTEEEVLEAECMARVFPEVRAELIAIQALFESSAIAGAVTPPASLKMKIMGVIDETPAEKEVFETKIISINKPQPEVNTNFKYMLAASVALLILSSFGVFYQYKNNLQLSEKINGLQQQQVTLENNLANNKSLLNTTQNELAIISSPRAIPVAMKGLPNSPNSLATVYWNKETKETFIAVNSLPIPQPGQQYQLWAIVDGAPVDLGVFDMPNASDSLLQKMKSIDNASAFAVTLEKEGGSPTPTMNQMYVMGNS